MSKWLFRGSLIVCLLGAPTYALAQEPLQLNYQRPQKLEIADIAVEGLEFLDERALISLTGLKIGDVIEVPGEKLRQATRNLWRQGLVGDVTISATQVQNGRIWLLIKLTERPRLARYTFTGLTRTQQDDLEDKLDLIRGRIVTDALLKNTELTIRNYFIDKGFLNAEVNMVRRSDTLVANGIRVDIVVKKNQRVDIEEIIIEGNEGFSDVRLAGTMRKTNEHLRFHIFRAAFRELFSLNSKKLKALATKDYEVTYDEFRDWLNENINLNFFRSGKFIPEEYQNDKKAMIAFLQSQGYRDAILVSDSVYSYDENSLIIKLKLDQGDKYYFRNITWKGNFVHDDFTLNRVLNVKKGDVYNMQLIDERLNFSMTGPDVSSLYMDNGYLAFTIDPVETAVVGDSIDLELRVNEGNQFYLNQVTVSGNTITNDHVVLREVRTLPGEKFSRADIIRTQRELSQLGYFNPETINPGVVPNFANNTVDLDWQLEEQHSSQVELSGGWGGFFGLVGTLGLSFNNFSARNALKPRNWRPVPLGDGQTLSIRAQANGRNFQLYSLSFTEPWLGGRKPNSFGFNINYSIQNATNFNRGGFGQFGGGFGGGGFGGGVGDPNDLIVTGSLKLFSVAVTLGRRITWPDDFFTLSNSLTFTRYELEEFGQTLGFSTGDANSFTLTTTLARNSVSAPIFPRSGSSMSLSLALTPPYSLFNNINYETALPEERFQWVEYHKWMLDTKHFMTVVGNLVMAARVHMGFIGSYSEEAGVGPFERFWLGGDGLAGQNILLGTDIIGLRGYQNSSIVPSESTVSGTVRGGIVYNKFVWELRYLVSPNPAATIYLHAFAEAGNNWNTYQDFNPFNLRRSAGVGARIFMPAFGLLGIDWGYGFDNFILNSGQESSAIGGSQIHFSIGQTIR